MSVPDKAPKEVSQKMIRTLHQRVSNNTTISTLNIAEMARFSLKMCGDMVAKGIPYLLKYLQGLLCHWFDPRHRHSGPTVGLNA
ncbi:hypothetical protein PoB_006605400 [Plakobranchus ocellatus]|uniref:Uncharacterized protein n=1 Tax=Plakobranchus ocellatus TaxID=259542 RepID=A0AAV4D5S5_9GAST|nr:hypothetical protein PoB_006605400 [Plakobranchus ocellatus]